MRGIADVPERETRNQCEAGLRRRLKHRQIVRLNDERSFDAIAKVFLWSRQSHLIAGTDTFECAEERVAMARQRAVAGLPRQWRIRKVPYRDLERFFVVAFNDDDGQLQSRDLELSDETRRDVAASSRVSIVV